MTEKEKIMTNVKSWIIGWFVQNSDVLENEIQKNVTINYLEKGWIDSFSFVTLITNIEEKFDIRFSNDEFQDRSFATIDGITAIIEGKINAGK